MASLQRRVGTIGAVFFGLMILGSCSKDKISADNSPGASGSAGSGGSAGSAGTGGTIDTGPVKCAADLPGPKLVGLRSPSGVPYCIDSTPVTWGQYHKFSDNTPFDPKLQPEHCSDNSDFHVKVSQGGENFGGGCAPEWVASMTDNMPMTCMDWCDAAAYCTWAGKRLCGKVGGGTIDVVPASSGFDLTQIGSPIEDEWFNACTVGGTSKYPFGNNEDGLTSSDVGCGFTLAKEKNLPLWDVNTTSKCHADKPPFDQVFWMAGGLNEYEGSCYLGGFQRACAAHGGMPSEGVSTALYGCTPVVTGAAISDAGLRSFRCCADAEQ